MLSFTPLTIEHHALLRRYYDGCDYHLCEYSTGTKLMWSLYLRPSFAQEAGCLIVRNRVDGEWVFDFPVPGPGGDVDAALTAIEEYCTETGTPPVISVVPEEKAPELLLRWPRFRLTNERNWKDYLYRAEDMAAFAGRKYSGQRNHINKFRKEYPNARFVVLTGEDMPLIEDFWGDYEQEFQKTSFNAKRELTYAKALARLLPEGWLLGGGLLSEGRLVAMSLAEKCGDTLIIHVEKALYSHQGAYPTLVQAFAAHFGGDCTYINREDDAGDQGLRTSKLQYLPVRLAGKLRFEVRCEADRLREIPTLTTPRLTLTPLEDRDEAAYNALCLDDDRNRWWGYDFRQDLKGELTEDYFLSVARHDFAARQAVNFAVRLDGHLIGEAVLYRFDWRGGAELGCRIDRAILYSASVLNQSCAALRGLFRQIIEDRTDILYPIKDLEVHQGLGFAAWCDNNRVLIGNRAYMEREGVPLPELEYEQKHSQNGTLQILYLAVSGNLHAMFVLHYVGGRNAARGLEMLQKENIRLLVSCEDPSLTARQIAEVYHLPEGMVTLLDQEQCTSLAAAEQAAPAAENAETCCMIHTQGFASLTGGLRAAEQAQNAENSATTVQLVSVWFSVVIGVLLTYAGSVGMLSVVMVLMYQAAWSALSLAVCALKQHNG